MLYRPMRGIRIAASIVALVGCFNLASAEEWAVTSIPFKIKGEKAVNNVKLSWEKLPDTDSYKVYRDGQPIAEVYSIVYDDYNLPIDTEHIYYVEALKSGEVTRKATPTKTRTFSYDAASEVYDNFDGKYLNKSSEAKPSGFKIGNSYYQYTIERMDRDTDSGKVSGWSVTEKKSADGISEWSKPREVAFYPKVNMEGNAFSYNPVTGKVVLSSHLEDESGYNAAKIFLAQITPDGGIEVGTAERPLGHDSRDQSLFIDTDNTAYLLSATHTNQDINIYRLDDTWTKPVELVNTICKGAHRETPYITKVDGEYYFFSSKASGWYPSQTMYCSTSDLSGEWSPLKEIGNNSTFDAQFNRIKNWNDVAACWSYHWGAQREHKTPAGNFPRVTILAFNNGVATMAYFRYVEFNDEHGVIPVQNGRILSLNCPVTAEIRGTNGVQAKCINDGAMCESSEYFKKNANAALGKPYMFTFDFQNNVNLSEINFATRLVNGSECAYHYTIEGSADNKKFDMLVDGRTNWGVGFQIHDLAAETPYRYLRLRVYDVVSVRKGNSQPWADGIYELTAYGTSASCSNNDLAQSSLTK